MAINHYGLIIHTRKYKGHDIRISYNNYKPAYYQSYSATNPKVHYKIAKSLLKSIKMIKKEINKCIDPH